MWGLRALSNGLSRQTSHSLFKKPNYFYSPIILTGILFSCGRQTHAKNLLPGTKIKLPSCSGDDDLSPHYRPLEMGIPFVFSSSIVPVLRNRLKRGQPLQPFLEILMQPAFIAIDENTGCDVHGIDRTQPSLHPLFRTRSSTSGVMLMNSFRLSVLKKRCSVRDFMASSSCLS